jgi:hypothetical protein
MVVVPLCLIMVNQHPQPVDDCPCFEDAIAIVSVLMGSLLARWHAVHYGFDERFFTSMMPGSASQTWNDVSVWWWFTVSKMVVGKCHRFLLFHEYIFDVKTKRVQGSW